MARSHFKSWGLFALSSLSLVSFVNSQATPPCNSSITSRTWTNEGDFIDSFDSFHISTRVIDDPYPDSSLTIKETPDLLDNIWIACSARGTIVRIDTQTRTVIGEYLTSPVSSPGNNRPCGHDPSRTTVDFDGNIWAGNRTPLTDSVVKIGSGFAYQWVDRNDSGTLDTSSGFLTQARINGALGWPYQGSCSAGAVASAKDELVQLYRPVDAAGVRPGLQVSGRKALDGHCEGLAGNRISTVALNDSRGVFSGGALTHASLLRARTIPVWV